MQQPADAVARKHRYVRIRYEYGKLFRSLFYGKVLFDHVITAGSEAIFEFIRDNDVGHHFPDIVLKTEYVIRADGSEKKIKAYLFDTKQQQALTAWEMEQLNNYLM